jgi:predicted nucleic acid-binding protein
LVSSDALAFEAARNPHPLRKKYAVEVLSKAKQIIHINSQVEALARTLHAAGIRPLDALHLASAIEAKADYFCTCDDKLLRRARTIDSLHTKIVSPLELVKEVGI